MGAYIFRRLWLMIPTLIGIMLINFTLIQFVPGGPIERIISQLEDSSSATDRITGAGSEVQSGGENSLYEGARGLPPDLIADLEKTVQSGQARLPAVLFDDGRLLSL